MFKYKQTFTGIGISVVSLLILMCTVGPIQVQASDQEEAVAVVEAYHQALASEDSVAARALLAEEAVVLESGHAETLEEYLGHHLGADMQFSAQVQSKRELLQVQVKGETAWVASTSMVEGEFRGREIRAAGVELMVLAKVEGNWKIHAIHWSSRNLD